MKKNTLYLSLVITFIMLCTACSDFLNLEPKSNFTGETFYRTEDDFKMALNGTYHRLQTIYNRYYYHYSEIRSDNCWHSGSKWCDENVISANDTKDLWELCWAAVHTANELIVHLEPFEMDATKKQDILTQARFIRALTYFNLVRFYGGVPIQKKPVNEVEAMTIPRQTAEKTYDFIISELEELKDQLSPEYIDNSKPSSVVAKALLAQVYLMRCGYPYYTGEWDKVRDYCQEVIATAPFNEAMTWDWKKIFSADGENSPEFIFSIKYKAGGIGENCEYNKWFSKLEEGSGILMSEDGFRNTFEEGDIRRDHSIATTYYEASTGETKKREHVIKFGWSFDSGNNEWGNDLPIIRYTDIKLMYAEALCEISGEVEDDAVEILKEVRTRAGLSTTEPQDIDSWRTALLDERRHEFAYEGVRWFDLVRSNTFLQALSDVGKATLFNENHYIFPIPQKEIDLVNNKDIMWQNPGYFGN